MTKKMPALFAKHPPRKPITNLDRLVDDWIYRFGANGVSKHMRDEVVEFATRARSYDEAVSIATNSLRPSGKKHNHQSRIPVKTLRKFADKIKGASLHGVTTFDALHDGLAHIAPPGIGPVTVYDVATRIGAYLKLEVLSLYLHAGVKQGWCKLHGVRAPAYDLRVPREELPKALQRIPTDEVEDMLCAYRDVLQPWLVRRKA